MWKPEVGARIKLKLWEQYTSRGLGPWSWFEVLSLGEETCRAKTVLCAIGVDSVEIDLPYSEIDPPLGWREVYECHADSLASAQDNLRKFKDWLATRGGVNVWASHDLGSPGRLMFTPGDVQTKPHWSMGLVETVTSIDRFTFSYYLTRDDKPPRSEKDDWTYDRRNQEWYRKVMLND